METIYYSATETNKLLRKALKDNFPDIKFSVRKSDSSCTRISFSASHATGEQVNKIAQNFRGADFDGMTDCENSVYHTINGQKIQYGTRYIFLQVNTENHPCNCDTCITRKLQEQSWVA